MKAASDRWDEFNQRHLVAALERVRAALERHALGERGRASEAPVGEPDVEMYARPAALETVCTRFGLSPFERDILLLCAGVELDSKLAALCAAAQGDAQATFPTFSLALASLPGAHWSALAPSSPLRYWRLIEIGAGHLITTSPLRIDERVLHYLAGVSYLDERLAAVCDPAPEDSALVPSHEALAGQIAAAWSKGSRDRALPLVELDGDEPEAKQQIARAACSACGLQLHIANAGTVPLDPRERDLFIRLWEREAALSGAALLLDWEEADGADAVHAQSLRHVTAAFRGPLILSSRTRLQLPARRTISLEVHRPGAQEQRDVWQTALGQDAASLNGSLDPLVAQFNLAASRIRAVAVQVSLQPPPADEFPDALWEACRVQARPRLNDLAQRLEPVARWNDLVLPDAQIELLRDIARQVRQRHTVYEMWGLAAKSPRGLGISALFVGASGTGKTMAAEVLANELRLDVYRIDLASVVSKYIGETEKNLRRVFDAAEEGGAILLFDEADALFGRRTEIKDSHDRYANIEVSYLLQRMEAYRGLAILTTNWQEALDKAFLRRIRFIVRFPFPDAAQRAEIWRRIFPTATPTQGLDLARLARLNVAGGNIRNIALNAAFLAADAGEPVQMVHLLRAARSEYGKLEKPLTDSEIRDWVTE